jgi:hypothetical protein
MPKPPTTPTQRATSSSPKASLKAASETPMPESTPTYRPLDEQDEWNERAQEEAEEAELRALRMARSKTTP